MSEYACSFVPVVRSGILAQEFCAGCAVAEVAAVFERSLYLRADDAFVCIGESAVGNGPSTLIADLGPVPPGLMQARAANSADSPPPQGGREQAEFAASVDSTSAAHAEGEVGCLSALGVRAGAFASISDREIAIGSIVFTLDRCALWRSPEWPVPSHERLAETCTTLARRVVVEAPQQLPLVSKRIARFEAWLSATSDTREAVHGIVGLGPGLTPSGDDVLIGALAMLHALEERDAHAALARAVNAIAPGLTSPLSHCFLRAAAAGHISERFHSIVSSVIVGDVDRAIATARTIGHSSGWDMLTGAMMALRSVGARKAVMSA